MEDGNTGYGKQNNEDDAANDVILGNARLAEVEKRRRAISQHRQETEMEDNKDK